MESAEPLAILLVVAAVALLMIGYPVALTLAGVSLIFAALGDIAGVMNFALLGALPQRIFGAMTNEVLLTIPLFVHGRGARALAHRRGTARNHGPAVRLAYRRVSDFRNHRREA